MGQPEIAPITTRIQPLDIGKDAARELGSDLSDQFGVQFNADRMAYAIQGPKALKVAVGIGALLQGMGLRDSAHNLQPVVKPRGDEGATITLVSDKIDGSDLRAAAHTTTNQLSEALYVFGSPYRLSPNEVETAKPEVSIAAVKLVEETRISEARRHAKRLNDIVYHADYAQRVTGGQMGAVANAGRTILSATAAHQGYRSLRFSVIGKTPLYISSYATGLSGVALRTAATATYEKANSILTQLDSTEQFALHKPPDEPTLPFLPVLA